MLIFFIKLDQQPYVWLSLWEQDKKVFFINFLHIKSLVLFCIQSWNTIYICLIQGKIFYIPVWLLQQWMMKHIFIRFHCVYVWLFKIAHLGSSLSLSPLLWAIAPRCPYSPSLMYSCFIFCIFYHIYKSLFWYSCISLCLIYSFS